MFCDLADTQSFTKAAQISGVTQSAVSQQLSSLERQFKSLLIERSKKGFRLTREGQVLYEHGKQIVQLQASLFSKMDEIKDIISGTIQVATIYSIGLHDLPRHVQRLVEQYPTVNVHVEYCQANEVYEDVLTGTATWVWSPIPKSIRNWPSSRSARTCWCWPVTRSIPWRDRNPSASHRWPGRS